MKKKIISIFLCCAVIFAMTGCNKTESTIDEKTTIVETEQTQKEENQTKDSEVVSVEESDDSQSIQYEENDNQQNIQPEENDGVFEPYLPADSDTINSYIESCKALLNEDEIKGITNYYNPNVRYQTLLDKGYYYSFVDDDYVVQTSEEGYCYSITFNTVSDALLGSITFYVDESGTVVGTSYRD